MPDERQTPLIAVAASGGCDSTALVFLMQKWVEKRNGKLIVLTVDHGLRACAKQEAENFSKMLAHHGIECDILTWQHDAFPQSAIQEQARLARYQLLEKQCRKRGVKTLAIAHQQQDQVETFLYRLTCGSGLDGLSCMDKTSEKNQIQIIRPLLNVPRECLKKTCQNFAVPWIDDPSNEKDQFTRVRFRKALDFLADEGLTAQRLCQTVEKLQQANTCLNRMTAESLSKQAVFYGAGFVALDYVAWQQNDAEIQQRSLIAILKWVSGQIYPPRMERLKKLLEALKEGKTFSRRTLSGCEVYLQKKNQKIWIYRELAAVEGAKKAVNFEQEFIWDHRFKVTLKDESMRVKILGAEGFQQIKQRYDECAKKNEHLQNIPACVKYTFVAITRDENILYIPYLRLPIDDVCKAESWGELRYLPSLFGKDHAIEIV